MRKCNLSYPVKALQNSLISYNITSFPYSLDMKILITDSLVIDVSLFLKFLHSELFPHYRSWWKFKIYVAKRIILGKKCVMSYIEHNRYLVLFA